MYLVKYIVLIQVDSNVLFAFPIIGDRVFLFKDSHEVLSMFISLVFYAKIVNA